MTQETANDHPSHTAIWVRRAVIGAGALALAVVVVATFAVTARTLALLFAAIVIAEAVAPVVDRLERWMPRGLAIASLYLALIVIVGGLLWFSAPQVTEQSRQLVENVPGYVEDTRQFLDEIELGADAEIWDLAQDNIGRITGTLVQVPMMLVTSVSQVVLITFMSAFWLMARTELRSFLRSLVPEHQWRSLHGVLDSLSATVGGYVRGVGISALIIGASVFIGLSLMGVQFAAVLAILSAFGELIPILGPIITAIPAVVVAFFQSPGLALAVIVFYVILQQVESNVIIPNVMSTQANIPPILVLFATAAGGSIGGILGAIVAIPIMGATKVLVVEAAAPGIRRWTGAESGPQTVRQATEQAGNGES